MGDPRRAESARQICATHVRAETCGCTVWQYYIYTEYTQSELWNIDGASSNSISSGHRLHLLPGVAFCVRTGGGKRVIQRTTSGGYVRPTLGAQEPYIFSVVYYSLDYYTRL